MARLRRDPRRRFPDLQRENRFRARIKKQHLPAKKRLFRFHAPLFSISIRNASARAVFHWWFNQLLEGNSKWQLRKKLRRRRRPRRRPPLRRRRLRRRRRRPRRPLRPRRLLRRRRRLRRRRLRLRRRPLPPRRQLRRRRPRRSALPTPPS